MQTERGYINFVDFKYLAGKFLLGILLWIIRIRVYPNKECEAVHSGFQRSCEHYFIRDIRLFENNNSYFKELAELNFASSFDVEIYTLFAEHTYSAE